MKAAKCAWQVTAGIIPGEPMPVYSRAWHYTSEDYERDAARPPDEATTFCKLRDQALDHAKEIMDPAMVNWVRVEWVWF